MERLFPTPESPGRAARSAGLRLVALLVAAAFAVSGVAGAGDLHPAGDACHAVVEPVCTLAGHPETPLHAEAAPTAEPRLCLACLLRAQSAGCDLPAPAVAPELAPARTAVAVTETFLPAAPRGRSVAPRGPPSSDLA